MKIITDQKIELTRKNDYYFKNRNIEIFDMA